MNKAVLEGLLFVVGEDGLTIQQIEEVLNVEEEESYHSGALIPILSNFLIHLFDIPRTYVYGKIS